LQKKSIIKVTAISINKYIQDVRKIPTNISGRDLGPQKKEKKLYINIGPEISRFRVIATFVKKNIFYIPHGIPF